MSFGRTLLRPHESGHRDAQSAAAHIDGRPTRGSGWPPAAGETQSDWSWKVVGSTLGKS